MPVGNEIFRNKVPARALVETELCRKCGYDLKGLTSDARCPECGTSIKTVKNRRQIGDTITDAPAAYLNFLTMSCWIAFVTLITSIGAYISSLVWDDIEEIRLVWATSCVCWVVAVFMLAADRQSLVTSRDELAKELRICRWIAKVSQIGWVIAAVLAYFELLSLKAANPGFSISPGYAIIPPIVNVMVAAEWVMKLIAMTGIGFLCLHLASLAWWARDERLEMRFRTCTYFLCGGVPLFLLGIAFANSTNLGGFFAYGMMLIMGGLTMVGWVLFLVSLMQLAMLSVWAMANAQAEAARDMRMLEKAEEERARASERIYAAPPIADLRSSGEATAPVRKPKGPYLERPRGIEGYEVKE